MYGLNYKRLNSISNSVTPYRGNADRFPLANRRENTKYFLVRDEEGQRVFDIVYGQRYHSTDLTEEQFYALEKQGCTNMHKYQKYDNNGQLIPDQFDYRMYETRANIIGRVRPDNTFEFNQKNYHQGERQFLSQFSQGWFYNDSRRGGFVYKNGTKFHPIYKGMRMETEKMEPIVPYEVFINHVDRKKAKALVAKYEHFYKVSEVMLKNMTLGMAVDTLKEVVDETWKDEGGTEKYRSDQTYFEEAERLIDDAPLDAFVLYCMALNVGRLAYQMRWANTTSLNDKSAHEELFTALKRRLSKEIYKTHRDIFKEVKCESGKRYPSCDWGVKIVVDGKEMEQYT
jgi:hypothetical protein